MKAVRAERLRLDCLALPRPCPILACRHNLASEPGFPSDAPYSCSLDAADCGSLTLEEVGECLGISRQSVQVIEQRALRKIAYLIQTRKTDLSADDIRN